MIDFKNLKVNDILSETQYYRVDKIVGNIVQLINDKGEYITVSKEYAEQCLISADQYKEEKVITKTELASLFLSNPNIVMTVNFNKLVKEEDVVKQILTSYETSTPKQFETAVKKSIKNALVGEDRTMVGRHYGSINELGRIQFIDMKLTKDISKTYDTRLRLVDPRSINWLVLNDVKYKLK